MSENEFMWKQHFHALDFIDRCREERVAGIEMAKLRAHEAYLRRVEELDLQIQAIHEEFAQKRLAIEESFRERVRQVSEIAQQERAV